MINQLCQNCHKEFVIDQMDLDFYDKVKVPPPTFCPECRLQRRLMWDNNRMLHKYTCGLCGKAGLSMYDPEGPVKSYCNPCWWSDKWNPLSYGREYDFSRPFFEQFKKLMEQVPQADTSVTYSTLTNTSYTNMNHELKNCYWIFNSDYDESCFFGEELERSKDCVDTTMMESCELAYQSVNCSRCQRVFFSVDCDASYNLWFSRDCTGCGDCFGCVGLRKKHYCLWNKQLSKEEYEKKIAGINLGSRLVLQAMAGKAREFWLRFPRKYMHAYQNQNATGDYIYNSRNVRDSFIVSNSDRCRYCLWLISSNNKDCWDFTQFGENTEQVYEAFCCGKNVQRVLGSSFVFNGAHDVKHSISCPGGSNLFGCVGVRGEYCILNSQYSKEKYDALVPRIIAHMDEMPFVDSRGRRHGYGDFFPAELSPFAYNETLAQDFMPLTKQEATNLGFRWRPTQERGYAIDIQAADIPDDADEVAEEMAGKIVACAHAGKCEHACTTAFRLVPQELRFYKHLNLPLPDMCPNCRYGERLKFRNPVRLWERKCQCGGAKSENGVYENFATHIHGMDKCPNEFETSYAPERPEIVYCEQCYQQEVS